VRGDADIQPQEPEMSRRSTLLISALLVCALTASFFVVHAIQRTYPSNSMEDVLFIPSPEFVKRASLGYSGLLADIYWTRVVQYFGTKHSHDAMEYKALAPLLDITTTLDPQLTVAYIFGSTFLQQAPPSGAGDVDAAIALIRKGIQNNPDDWHLYFNLGFTQYLGQHDYLGAAKTFEEGSRVPHAHPSMKVLAAKMLTDAGSLSTARYMWQSIYQESSDKSLKQNAELHLACLLVDQEVPELEKLVAEFSRRFGRKPTSWRDLIATGALRSVPLDPTGRPYVLTADGHVVVADANKLPFINAGKPA
jgi:tetratricopeptide (TPR) repeat protein